MSKKNKKLAKSVVPKAVKPPKPEKTAVVSRKTYTWTERALMRAEKAGRLLNRLAITIASAQPVGFEELHAYDAAPSGSLGLAYEVTQSLMTRLAALPGDFEPKYKRTSTALAVGATIGVADEHANDPVFTHIPAALFELAVIIDADGKQNWLVRCADGVVRTIRKVYVEAVSDDGDADDEQLEDSDEDAE